MQPMKSLLDAGIPLAIGSDGPINPFLNIMSAIDASGQSARSADPRAGGHRVHARLGVRRVCGTARRASWPSGMLADLAVLSADVFTVPPNQMEAIRSVLTMIGGRTAHDAG